MAAQPNRRNLISCPMTHKSTRQEPLTCRTKMTCSCSCSRSSSSCRRHSRICVETTTRPLQIQLKMAPSETQKAQMYHQVPRHRQYSQPWQTSNSNSLAAPLTLAARKETILGKAPKTMATRATTQEAKYQISNRTRMVANMAPPSNSNSSNRWASNSSSNPLVQIRKTPQ